MRSLRKSMTLGAALGLTVLVAGSVFGAWSRGVRGNYGPAPEFAGIAHWLNSDKLTMAALRGRVVLVEFWTSDCVNCLRTLPYIAAWYEKYRTQGFVVVGVHSPETELERRREHVEEAIRRRGITYPVAQDNDYATWNAFENPAWPASYLIDRQGRIVRRHYGEGGYREMETAIRELLLER
jgi:thiol-disulfide isomerase/thioredoxin